MTSEPSSSTEVRRTLIVWFAGAASAAVAVALLWMTDKAVPAIPFPPLLLAERLIRIAPGDLATFLIEVLQVLSPLALVAADML